MTLTHLSALSTLQAARPDEPGRAGRARAGAAAVDDPGRRARSRAWAWSRRTPHPTDGRQVVIELTPAAQELLAAEARAREAWLSGRLQRAVARGAGGAARGRGHHGQAGRRVTATDRIRRRAPEPAGDGMFRALRVRNFRRYASANLVSQTGTWMQRIGQDWLVLQLSDDSGVALGLITALQFGPTVLLSMYGGVLADRYAKRRLLLITQAADGPARAACSASWSPPTSVALWHVFVLAGGLGAVVGDRRAGPAVLRLGDGRARAADQRGQPQLDDLQRRPAGRAGGGRSADRPRRRGTPRRRSSSTRPASRFTIARAGLACAPTSCGPAPRSARAKRAAAGGAGLHLGAPRPACWRWCWPSSSAPSASTTRSPSR